MFKNHFPAWHFVKTAWRTFTGNKLFSSINLLSLTIGLCACMLVLSFVMDELSYDRFWKRSDDIYRVLYQRKMAESSYMLSASSPAGLGEALKTRFPELESFAMAAPSELDLNTNENNTDGIKIKTIRGDSSLTGIFDFNFIAGNAQLVSEKNNLIITESLRNKLFKGKDPVGQAIYNMPTWEEQPKAYHIIAVIKDIPSNTHFHAEAIELERARKEELDKNGNGNYTQFYFLLKPHVNPKLFEAKINKWYAGYMETKAAAYRSIQLQPLKDVYLHSDFDTEPGVKGSYRNVYIIGCTGILLLLIGCINFINLTTARAFKRLKETGIRKILGADRKQLVCGFLVESGMYFFIATALALLLFSVTLPRLELFIGHQLETTLFSDSHFLLLCLAVIIVLSILTGLYPAWVLSGFRPVNNLRGRFSKLFSAGPASVRMALVFVQFVITISVLAALIITNRQMNYINKKDIGYQKDNLLYIGLHTWEGKAKVLKNELLKIKGVNSVSFAGWYPESGVTTMYSMLDNPLNKEEKVQLSEIVADFDFPKTIGLQVQAGRLLQPGYGTDHYDQDSAMKMDKDAYIAYKNNLPVLVTASTARQLGVKRLDATIKDIGFKPVGILKDFHRESLFQPLSPTMIFADDNIDYSNLFIRINPEANPGIVQDIHNAWKKVYPARLFDVQWVTDMLAKQYEVQYKQQMLFMLFSILMLCVAAMGVFGLIVHATQQREKEIGIRKVLGSSVTGIVRLLTKDMVLLVVLALAVAVPLSWWAMNQWLQAFAYRISIQWWMFALAGLTAILIALLTVSVQAIKAAMANPVKALRSE
ncbi:FtsX-like permease family protein [Parafilimonas sp.]|uniref:ABC transporter permease n=1 Tax=Parafilimonas sp. TaxID=1969739 RepID=UPI0039E69B43